MTAEATASLHFRLGCSTIAPLPSSVLFRRNPAGQRRQSRWRKRAPEMLRISKDHRGATHSGGCSSEALGRPPKGPTRCSKSAPLASNRMENANVLEFIHGGAFYFLLWTKSRSTHQETANSSDPEHGSGHFNQ